MSDDLDRLNRLLDDLAQERDPADRAALSADEAELAETAAFLKGAAPGRSMPDEDFVARLGARLSTAARGTTTGSPGTDHPESGHPESSHPESSHPETGHPEIGHPGTGTAPASGVSRRTLLGRAAAVAAGLAVGAGAESVAASGDSTQAYEHGRRVGYQTGERVGYQKATTEAFSTPMVPHDRGTWLATGHTTASIAPGSAVRFRAGAVEGFLVNPGQGQPIYALSAACTHMGCMISWLDSARTFLCPCHGAQYNADGSVLSGIARNPLPPLRVWSDKTGALYVWTVGEHPTTTTLEPYTRP